MSKAITTGKNTQTQKADLHIKKLHARCTLCDLLPAAPAFPVAAGTGFTSFNFSLSLTGDDLDFSLEVTDSFESSSDSLPYT